MNPAKSFQSKFSFDFSYRQSVCLTHCQIQSFGQQHQGRGINVRIATKFIAQRALRGLCLRLEANNQTVEKFPQL